MVEAQQRVMIRSWSKTTSIVYLVAESMGFTEESPQWIVPVSTGHASHLMSFGAVYQFPDLDGGGWDPAVVYPAATVARLMRDYEFNRFHRAICSADPVGMDGNLFWGPRPLALIRWGMVEANRRWIGSLQGIAAHWLADGYDAGTDAWAHDSMLCGFGPVELAAGLAADVIALIHASGVPAGVVTASSWGASPVRASIAWERQSNERGNFTNYALEMYRDGHRLRHFCYAPDEVDRAVTMAWLDAVPPGETCTVGSGTDGSFDIATGSTFLFVSNTMEAEARLLLGQHRRAIATTEVLATRFPFNAVLRLTGHAAVAGAHAGQGQRDAAVELLRSAADDAHAHSVFFVELMLATELHALAAAVGSAAEVATAAARLAKRAVAAMKGCAPEVAPLLAAHGMSLE